MLPKAQALNFLHNATLALLELDQKAKPSDRQRLDKAWKILNQEYTAAAGISGEYGPITDAFKHSKDLIKGIVDDRNKITTDITIATNILQALAPLVALLA
jgi:hypothetical protein